MPYQNIPETNLEASIAKLIRRLRGTFENSISLNTSTLGDAFKKGCPNDVQKRLLLNKLNNIKTISVNTTERLNRFRRIPPPLKGGSTAVLALVSTLKFIPFPPFFPGGKVADALTLVKELGVQLKTSAEQIELALKQTEDLDRLLKETANIGERIDTALEVCKLSEDKKINLPIELVNDLVNGTARESSKALKKLNSIVGVDEKIEVDTQNLIPLSEENYTGPDGTIYTLKIITVKSDFTRAPRRQAVALNPTGIKKYESSKSFSSSVEVLKREVKFRIDNSQV